MVTRLRHLTLIFNRASDSRVTCYLGHYKTGAHTPGVSVSSRVVAPSHPIPKIIIYNLLYYVLLVTCYMCIRLFNICYNKRGYLWVCQCSGAVPISPNLVLSNYCVNDHILNIIECCVNEHILNIEFEQLQNYYYITK